MASSDWDKELAKIDKQLGTLSDDALLKTMQPNAAPAVPAAGPVAAAPRTTTTLGVLARLGLATALGVGMYFWPYSARCGAGLFGYLAAAGVVVAAGLWSAAWTWRHRSAAGHTLSLAVILWGGMLAAREVLPKVGSAIPTEAHPAAWMCG